MDTASETTSDTPLGRLGERGALAAVVAVAVVLALIIASTTPLRVFENHLSDLRQSRHGRVSPPSRDLVIIAMDDQTLALLPYTSPISRTLLASVARELDKRGARVIGFDILFDRPSDPVADAAFADAVAAARAPVVAVTDPGGERRRALCGAHASAPETGDLATAAATGRAGTVIAPLAGHVATGHGVLCLDAVDDVVRTARFDPARPSFVEAILTADGRAPRAKGVAAPLFQLTAEGRWPFPTYSAAHLAALPREWIAGKIALVGRITPYSGDWRLTPLRHADLAIPVYPGHLMPEGELPGVVVHAYALEAALTGRFGPRSNPIGAALVALLAGLGGAAFGAARAPWWMTVSGVASALTIGWIAVFVIYAAGGPMIAFSPGALAFVIATGGALAWRERRERARRHVIHQAFQHFLAPDIVDALVRQPEGLRLEAAEAEITVLFTDLAGFTRLIDTMAPADLARVLNGYLDHIVEAVMTSGGVVDKIVGDAVHALFSTPIADPDHRRTALRCALAIRARTEAYRHAMAAEGVAIGATRIGVNSGPALVGNFGAGRRLDFTAHGSTVNIAARLEAANKVFGTHICASAAARVEDPAILFRTIGPVAVRGIERPVCVFEVTRAEPAAVARAAAYEAALAVMAHDPSDAARRFAALADADPADALAGFQLTRARSADPGAPIAA